MSQQMKQNQAATVPRRVVRGTVNGAGALVRGSGGPIGRGGNSSLLETLSTPYVPESSKAVALRQP